MKRLFTLLFILSTFSGFNQTINLDLFKGMKFRSIGPAGMSGRITSIDVVLANPDIIYIGTASGGVWKSESGGVKWEPIFDKEPVQSIGAIAIQQSNPSVIWAGAGEGNPRNSHNSGNGIYKSLDGGKTWKHLGLDNTKTIHRIIIHRDNPDVVTLAALGSAWGPNPERGIFQTKDGGKTWKKILFINDQTGCADLVVDPTNPNKMIAAMWEYWRKPWFFNSGGKGSGLYITHDGGETWQQKTEKNGLPKGDLGRIGLAISRSKPNIIYALVEAKVNGLYRSEDGGNTWKLRATKNIGNRPFYYAELYVDPQNENRIYNLWSRLSLSEDGGKTFEEILGYGISGGVHPDHHAFWIHPENPDYIIEGNDGGLNFSHDGGKNWRFVENLPLAQFYHINYDMDLPYNVYGGMQDNGSWRGPAYVWQHGGIRNAHWQELLFGDGFDVVPMPADSRYGYAMSQGGNVNKYDVLTGRHQYIQPIHPEGKTLRFNWNAAIAQDPNEYCTVYFGSQFLHKSIDCGDSWEIISPDLTTNDPEKQKQAESGGLTIDATTAENFTSILAIAPSSLDKNVIWVGTDDGNIQLTKDGGKTWSNLSSRIKDFPAGAWVPQIVASEYAASEAFVIVNNYRQNDWRPYIYKTTDFGNKWTRIADETKMNGHALSVVQDPVAPNLLFAGTDYGLYISIDGGSSWTKWRNDYPSVSTTDLKIHPREHDLIAGTFGRSAFILDDIRPLRQLALEGISMTEKQLQLFDIPDAYLTNFKVADGVRFSADAIFAGDNKRSGAMISFWVKAPEPKSEKENENDKEKNSEENVGRKKDAKKKVFFTIFNSQGDTIRNFGIMPDTGINRIHWGLDRNGIEMPSYHNRKVDADPPRGSQVLPGKYLVVIQYQGLSDSSEVTVLPDPRSIIPKVELDAKEVAIERFQSIAKKATKGFNYLKEAKSTLEKVKSQLADAPDTLKKEIIGMGKTIKDSISVLMELYMMPEDFKGLEHFTKRLNSKLYSTANFINSCEGRPSPSALLALDLLEKEVGGVVARINRFILESWNPFRLKVEAIPYTPFKDFKPID